MTFYVEKKLALGSISFGVMPGHEPAIDDDPTLSTGAGGEFIRHRKDGFFFGGPDRFAGPTLPVTPTISSTAFWTSLKPDGTPRRYGFLALLAFGALFVLIGLAVIARKGPQGWVEVILGLAMIATPIVLTAQERQKIREQEERDRAEREATEKRNREMLTAYTTTLEKARTSRDEAAFAQLQRESEALTLPHDLWRPVAYRTVLLIAFDELARMGPNRSNEVTEMIERAGKAAGLTPEDATSVKTDLYRTIVWHLLADDRLVKTEAMRRGLAIEDVEDKTVTQFEKIRKLTVETLPRVKCSLQLGFNEHCILESVTDQGTLHVTNKRLILEARKRLELPIARAADASVSVDAGTVIVKTDNPKKPLRLRVEEPVYLAGLLDTAARIDDRPRGFA